MESLNKLHVTDVEHNIEVVFDKSITIPVTVDGKDLGVEIYLGQTKIGKWAIGAVDDDRVRDIAGRISLTNKCLLVDAKEIPDEVWHAFHKVWTWCVGRPGYDKKQFTALEAKLFEACKP